MFELSEEFEFSGFDLSGETLHRLNGGFAGKYENIRLIWDFELNEEFELSGVYCTNMHKVSLTLPLPSPLLEQCALHSSLNKVYIICEKKRFFNENFSLFINYVHLQRKEILVKTELLL